MCVIATSAATNLVNLVLLYYSKFSSGTDQWGEYHRPTYHIAMCLSHNLRLTILRNLIFT